MTLESGMAETQTTIPNMRVFVDLTTYSFLSLFNIIISLTIYCKIIKYIKNLLFATAIEIKINDICNIHCFIKQKLLVGPFA